MALALIALGCENSTVCADPPRFAVSVRVRDASTGAAAAFGATLVVRDGQYADSVTGMYPGPDESQASFLGAAEERPGTYDVTVRRAGYQTWTRQGLVVKQGECAVDGITLDVQLSRSSP